MRTVSPELKAHMAAETATLATVWMIRRRDGQTFFQTDHDQDLVSRTRIGSIAPPVTFSAAQGYSRTAIGGHSDLSVDTVDLGGFFADPDVIAEIRARRFDYAEVMLALVNWADMSMGAMILKTGFLGELILSPSGRFDFEVRSLSQRVSQSVGDTYQPMCRVDLGDPHTCNAPPSWFKQFAGRVTALVDGDRHRFGCLIQVPGTLAHQSSRYFNGGTLRWLSGDNAIVAGEAAAGHAAAVRRGTKFLVDMAQPTPFPAQIGDKFLIWPGCDKRLETCHTKFRNAENFRGEPHLPGRDFLLYQAVGRGRAPPVPQRPGLTFAIIDDQIVQIGSTLVIELSQFLSETNDPGTVSYYAVERGIGVRALVNRATGRLTLYGARIGPTSVTVTAEGVLGGRATTVFLVRVQELPVDPDATGAFAWREIPDQQVEIGTPVTIDLSDYAVITGTGVTPVTYSSTDIDSSIAASDVTGIELEVTGIAIGRTRITVLATGGADGSIRVFTSVEVNVVDERDVTLAFTDIPTQMMSFGGVLAVDLRLYARSDGVPGTITFAPVPGTSVLTGLLDAPVFADDPANTRFSRSLMTLTAPASDPADPSEPGTARVGVQMSGENGGLASTVIDVQVGLVSPTARIWWEIIPRQEVQVGQTLYLDLDAYIGREGDVGDEIYSVSSANDEVLSVNIASRGGPRPDTREGRPRFANGARVMEYLGVAEGRVKVTASVVTSGGQQAVTLFTVDVEPAPPPPPPRPPLPAKVLGVEATVRTGDQVDVEWDAPAEGDTAIAYRVLYTEKADYDADSAFFANNVLSDTTNVSIRGLDPETDYVLVVEATADPETEVSRRWGPRSDLVELTTGESSVGIPSGLVWTPLATGDGGPGTLRWNAAANAVRYRVWWKRGRSGPINRLHATGIGAAGTSRQISLTKNTSYVLAVVGLGAGTGPDGTAIRGPISEVLAVTTPGGPLPAPVRQILRIHSSGRIVLAWNEVPGATAYSVQIVRLTGEPAATEVNTRRDVRITQDAERSGTLAYHSQTMMQVARSVRSITVSTALAAIVPDTWYYARVQARGRYEGQRSPWSDWWPYFEFPTSVIMGRPRLEAVQSLTDHGQIDLTWTAVAGATGYQYRWYEEERVGTQTISAVQSGLSAEVDGLDAGTSYELQVRAVGPGGEGEWSYPSQVVTAPYRDPEIPRMVMARASTSTNGAIVLTWRASARAERYQFRFRLAGQTPEAAWSAPSRSRTTTTASRLFMPGTQYDFQVRSLNSAGTSDWSSVATATAPAL